MWWYPRRRRLAGQVIAADEMADDFREVFSTLEGGTDEHNWSQAAFASRTALATNAVLTIQSDYTDQEESVNHGPPFYFDNPIFQAGRVDLAEMSGWTVIETLDVDARNSLLWITASFQQYNAFYLFLNASEVGAQWAVRIDGTMMLSSMMGSVDRSNDSYGEAACMAQLWPGLVTGLMPVTPGRHTVELVAREVRTARAAPRYIPAAFIRALSRELICFCIDPPGTDSVGTAMTYPAISEGDGISAATTNTAFQAFRTRVNSQSVDAIKPESLYYEHLPTIILDAKHQAIVGNVTHTGHAVNLYYNTRADCVFHELTNGAGSNCRVTFTAPIDLADTTIRGIYVQASVQVDTLQIAAGHENESYACIAVFRFEYLVGATWYSVPRTHRFFAADNTDGAATDFDRWAVGCSMDYSAFLVLADIAPVLKTVAAIRVACSVMYGAPTGGTAAITDCSYRTTMGNISAFALQAG